MGKECATQVQRPEFGFPRHIYTHLHCTPVNPELEDERGSEGSLGLPSFTDKAQVPERAPHQNKGLL